ncbi:MAG TPA: urocanate hydratase [Candidatus Dormibacteraeota bacterium]|nr:urocanate hydratase [Candidatus Dormibacteraeota bacterium]
MNTIRRIVAARGTELRCRGWRQEGLLRMLENVLEVGERPEDLIVYASLAKAARDWPSFDRLVAALKMLGDGETLVVQSGKPIGVFPTHPLSPIVVMATSNVVGHYATPENFYELADRGLTMWGGLTAGDWQYIGSQGVLQGIYEVLSAVAREHFGGSLAGRLVLTAGLGGMGSAQPVAIGMLGAVGLVVEVDPTKLERSTKRGDLAESFADLDAALAACTQARANAKGVTFGLLGNAADVFSELANRNVTPDIVTDLTGAHDALYGYVPQGLGMDEWSALRKIDPTEVMAMARQSMAVEVKAMLAFKARGAITFENGNNLRVQATEAGVRDAFTIDGFAERYIRPLFCRGIGPFRWVALSGEESDLARLDDLAGGLFIERPEVKRWIDQARTHVVTQGLPARSCWLGHGERSRFATAVNAMVTTGELTAPVVFTRDHFDSGGMTHPHIGTEGMADGSDAISDWPLLDALLICSTGADLVAIHGGGGGYSGYMQSAGVTIVADGTEAAAERLSHGLDADTGLGVLRYADAGYEVAAHAARTAGLGLVTGGGA